MPFIAELDDERVIPEGIDDGQDVLCIHCNGRMRARGPMDDGRARHFFHVDNLGDGEGGGGCEGGGVGESEIHRKYKSHAVGRLRQLYPDFIEFCRPEQRLGMVLGEKFQELPSGKDDRQADAMMLLEEPTRTFGRGMIVEVQYRNFGKDIEETTRDYLENGFSVLWVDEDDFESDRCLLTKKQIRLNVISVWPNAVPDSTEWGDDYVEGLDMADFRLLSCRWYRADPSEIFREQLDNYWRANVAMMPKEGDKFEAPTIEATLPNDFIDGIAHDVKRMYEWGDLFDPPNDFSPIWGYSKVPATLPPEWHEEKSREFWRDQPWIERFWLSYQERIEPLVETGEKQSISIDAPIAKFILDEADAGFYKQQLKKRHFQGRSQTRNDLITVTCLDCGSSQESTVTGGAGPGMTSYSRYDYCEGCGEKTWQSVGGSTSRE